VHRRRHGRRALRGALIAIQAIFDGPARTGPFHKTIDQCVGDAGTRKEFAGLLEEAKTILALGLHGDPVRDLDQDLDEAVDDLGLAGRAPHGEGGQADARGVAPEFPCRLDRGAAAKALEGVGMHAGQEIRRQTHRADPRELVDLGEQAVEPHLTGISGKPRIGSAVAIIGQEHVEPAAHRGREAPVHCRQNRMIVRGARRA
jgi:hypothetical protein